MELALYTLGVRNALIIGLVFITVSCTSSFFENHTSAMQDNSLVAAFYAEGDSAVNVAQNETHLYKCSESDEISRVYLDRSDSFSSNLEDSARYNDVWFLLSLLDRPKNSDSLTESVAPSLSSLLQCACLI